MYAQKTIKHKLLGEPKYEKCIKPWKQEEDKQNLEQHNEKKKMKKRKNYNKKIWWKK
jgi:hypothetical protein